MKNVVSYNTYRNYKANMLNHIIPYFEEKKLKLQDLKPWHLEEYYRTMLKDESRLDGTGALSATTLRHHHQNISKALSDALKRGLIYTNPASTAKAPKPRQFVGDFLNPAELKILMQAFKNNVIELPVMLTVIYGFRRSEVLGLKWSNIDFVNNSITISETLQEHCGGPRSASTKTFASYRTLPLTKKAFELLKQQKAKQEENRKLYCECYIESDYVCTWDDGRVISPNYVTKNFKLVLEKNNIRPIRFHDLRHSTASNLLAQGFSVVEVQQWLGHSSPATTLNFYSHVDKRAKNAVADRIDEMF